MEEFKSMLFINSAEIHCGGLFGETVERNFSIERRLDDIPARIVVQQYYMKLLDKQKIRELITTKKYEIDELEEQLKGLEYFSK